MKRYAIVSFETMDNYVEKVEEWLNSGWELVGGVSAIRMMASTIFFQAVTKEIDSSGGRKDGEI